jgi:hypothetical protein
VSRPLDWLIARDATDWNERGMLIRSRMALLMLPVMAVVGIAALIRYLIA